MIRLNVERFLCAALAVYVAASAFAEVEKNDFLRVNGKIIVNSAGEKFFIRGTNLGNWLNPEGYMFGFKEVNSAHFIDEALRQLVGPEETDNFWRAFKANYVTEDDIRFIAATGSNTVRIPFHYKLFTREEYLGGYSANDGFELIDPVVAWCGKHNLRVVLDMHDCPGGQTGDNIDDSYGYPWLFTSEREQRIYCEIWRRIAEHYAANPVILGYDLMNEPISSRLNDKDWLNTKLESVQKAAVAVIRTVDTKHIVILAGAQWNSNFAPFKDWKFDSNMMYTCHRYWTDPKHISDFVAFRDKTGLPMFMGETGHNNYEWYKTFTETMVANDIGYTYWPVKMPKNGGWLAFDYPEDWDLVKNFAAANRSSYAEIQKNRPDMKKAAQALRKYAENCQFKNCRVDGKYLEAVGLRVPKQ